MNSPSASNMSRRDSPLPWPCETYTVPERPNAMSFGSLIEPEAYAQPARSVHDVPCAQAADAIQLACRACQPIPAINRADPATGPRVIRMQPNDHRRSTRVAEPSPQPQRPQKRLRSFLHRNRNAARFGLELDRTALKDGIVVILPVLLLVVGAFWLASHYVRPAPPDAFVMATGTEGGAYHLFGERYRDILARDGVRVELRPSAGSVQNLKWLTDPSSDVEAAFMQAGVASNANIDGLESLGGIYYEPLWIFYRGARDLGLLNDLVGKRLAIGPEGSGTRALALQLMHAVGADSASTVFEPLGGDAAIEALQKRAVDALFVVASPEAPIVQRLVDTEGIRLLSLSNAEAFARRFPYLSVLKLPHGVFDLAKKRPARDVTVLAATASIVAREQLHPALAFLLLNAATEVHAASGILHRYREFPAARETEFPLSDEAQRYFKTGQPFLRRYLPYWLANLVERTLVMLLPLVAVLVPAMRILPGLWQWRVKSRVFRWYGEIKFLEAELLSDPRAERIPQMLARLDEIEQGVDRTPVPRNYSDYAYNLRTHIEVVRNRILRMAQASAERQTPGHAREQTRED